MLCFGAEEHASTVLTPLYDELERDGPRYELVLVANYWSDSDRTPAVAEEFARNRPTVRTIAHPKRGAMGWDMRSGLRRARGDYVVVIDGDGQVPTHYALEAYRQLTGSGAPVVKGRRFARDDGSIRSLTSLGYNLLFRLLFGTRRIWDINGRPKGFTREAVELLHLSTDDWFTDAEIVLKAKQLGLRIHEFPVRFLRNEARRSFVGPDTVYEFLRNMALWRLGRHPVQRRDRMEEAAAAFSDERR